MLSGATPAGRSCCYTPPPVGTAGGHVGTAATVFNATVIHTSMLGGDVASIQSHPPLPVLPAGAVAVRRKRLQYYILINSMFWFKNNDVLLKIKCFLIYLVGAEFCDLPCTGVA